MVMSTSLVGTAPRHHHGPMEHTERFANLVTRAGVPLDVGALLIAAHAHAGDIEASLTGLDELAAQCPSATVDGLCEFLFGAAGFTGDSLTYGDPENSMLDRVLQRRLGIPITLSVVTMEVGRRLGVDLVGVGMPGHFLVRVSSNSEQFIDPFHLGRRLDARGCEQLLSQIQGRTVSLHPSSLAAVDNRAILWRMLTNLKAIYAERRDWFDLEWVLRLRCRFPDAPDNERAEHSRVLTMFN
jgi:regulator of sirC expression with transglutaminase-like and TPR domain